MYYVNPVDWPLRHVHSNQLFANLTNGIEAFLNVSLFLYSIFSEVSVGV